MTVLSSPQKQAKNKQNPFKKQAKNNTKKVSFFLIFPPRGSLTSDQILRFIFVANFSFITKKNLRRFKKKKKKKKQR